MTITNARIERNELILTLANPADAGKLVYRFKAGEYTIEKVKQKRSLDANAFAWLCINRIAEKIHEPPVEVYRRYIRDIGSKRIVTCVRLEDLDTEVKTFTINHIGRMVNIGESKIPGCATVEKIYGSSDYTVEQMSALIDAIVQDCDALDIETKTQEEIEKLLHEWRKGAEV